MPSGAPENPEEAKKTLYQYATAWGGMHWLSTLDLRSVLTPHPRKFLPTDIDGNSHLRTTCPALSNTPDAIPTDTALQLLPKRARLQERCRRVDIRMVCCISRFGKTAEAGFLG
jgi:hypothetical protein